MTPRRRLSAFISEDELPTAAAVASAVLSAAGVVRAPVELGEVLRLWPGLRVGTEALDGAGYLIALGGNAGEILLRRDDSARRQRFTLAHEIGHWLLGPGAVPDGHDDEEVETWCDRFAVELLLPSHLVREHIGSSQAPSAIAQRMTTIASKFNASTQASMRRGMEVMDLRALAAQRDGVFTFQAYEPQLSNAEKIVFHRFIRDSYREGALRNPPHPGLGAATAQAGRWHVFLATKGYATHDSP